MEKQFTVGHSVAQMLLRHGIHEFFGQGLPQGLSLPFEEMGIRQVAYRTENGGGYMTDGYARVSKKPGVMIAQNGPAATLVVPAVAEALKSSIPMIVLLQEVPLAVEDKNAFQEFDHIRLFSACTKWTRRVTTASRMEDYIDQAFTAACSGRPGPAVLLIPNDMLGQPAQPSTRKSCLGHYPLDPVQPATSSLRVLAERLLESKNPVIVAGGGVHSSSACEALAQLQDEFSLPVATTVMGKGSVSELHPLSLGVMANALGPCSMSRHQRPILEEADFILLIGSRTDQNSTDSWRLYPREATFAHIDMDGSEVGRNYEALRFVGDARLTIEALIEVMRGMDASKRTEARAALEARIAEGRAKTKAEMEELLARTELPMHPAQVMAKLEDVVTEDTIVVADASFSSIWATNNIRARKVGQRFITPRGMAGLGWGLPMALGAAVAKPEAPIFVISGDGGFAHVWSEMEVAVREKLKVTMIIIDNDVLGYVKTSEMLRYGKNSTSVFMAPIDHVGLAKACGFDAVHVDTPEEMEAALKMAAASDKPFLIEAKCTDNCPPITDFVGR